MKAVKCLVFDAYGTLFDVHSVTIAAERIFPGRGSELSKAWRIRQLEYTWLRSLMNRYEDFWRVTESALVAACNAMKLRLGAAARAEIMEAYLRLAAFPDVKQTVTALTEMPLAILSNGSPKMLEEVVKNAGLKEMFSSVINIDEVKIYKPSAAAYELAVRKVGVATKEMGFVSSNFFDVAGAKAFGFRTYWINRSDSAPDELGVSPDVTLKSLTDLIDLRNS